jgi:tetratricopeptide (TPR) repeat protein/tRNA A-37 threonylcarbamoyl transferase component Bud32
MPLQSDGDAGGSATPQGGAALGRYTIERTLGQGAMGEVLLARDTLLHRRVALKRLLPTGEDRAQQRAAILKEARRASQINDRHVAAIHDVLELDDQIVLVMEYVDGVTLRQRMAEPVSLDAFWDLATQCVEGMAAAHAHGVIHRDIKPENLMLTRDGQVKFLDFGIARRSGTLEGRITTTTESLASDIAGTPQYMAPEAHLGGTVDQRTDIFALGAVFYELLTTKRPFDGTTYAAVVDRVLNVDPPPVSDLIPAAGLELSNVVASMLAKNPAQRLASSRDLMERLERVRRGGVAAAPSPAAGGLAPPVAPGASAGTIPGRVAAGRRSRLPGTRPAWMIATLSVAGALVAVTIAIGWSRLRAPALPRARNVALLAPVTSGGGDFAPFALGAVTLLARRLRQHTDTRGFQLASFSTGVEEGVSSAAEARKVMGVNLAIIPTLEQDADLLRARLDLIDAASGRRLATRTVRVAATQPFEFLDQTYRAAAWLLGVDARGGDAASACGVHGAGTLRFYLQGIGRMRAARDSGAVKQASSDFETACGTEPGSAVTRAGLASAQLRLFVLTKDPAMLASSEVTAREAVGIDSGRAEPHVALASVLVARGNLPEALVEYTRASRLDPSDDEVAFRIARTYAHLGQPAKEKEAYLAAIAGHPYWWQPYWWLATWHAREGNVEESIRADEQMILRSPDFYQGYANLGGMLVQRGSYAPAIDALKRSLALRPTKEAFNNLATAYFNSGRLEEAIDAYNQSFQFGTAGYESWLNLGDAYFWLRNRKDEAAQAYAQAVRLGRERIFDRRRFGQTVEDVMISANLATVFPKLGQRDSASLYIARAVSADSANPMVDYCAALTYWQLDRKDVAMTWLEKSVHGGYPVTWLRDSPIFREWRTVPAFAALVDEAKPKP